MIHPRSGVAFSLVTEGDQRSDSTARGLLARRLGVPNEWATVSQVHGNRVVEAFAAGDLGEADAIFTTRPGLPVAVFTADCAGVVLTAASAVGVAHAGWRGAAARVVAGLVEAMAGAGHPPRWGAIGPSIGPCCFEVGAEVAVRFPEHTAQTTWGTTSVDLWRAVVDQVPGVELWRANYCTFHNTDAFSHRRDATTKRMAAVGWRS